MEEEKQPDQADEVQDNQLNKRQRVNPEEKGGRVIFILPFAGPNSGKTFTINELQEFVKKSAELAPYADKWSFASVSSDQIRGEETEKLLKNKKNLTRD